MAQQLGMTSAYAVKALNNLRGVAQVVPVLVVQLHDGFPGVGTANVFAGAVREAILFSEASTPTMSMTSTPPVFIITAPTDVDAPVGWASLWTGYVGDGSAYCVATGALSLALDLAAGDQLSFGTATVTWKEIASA